MQQLRKLLPPALNVSDKQNKQIYDFLKEARSQINYHNVSISTAMSTTSPQNVTASVIVIPDAEFSEKYYSQSIKSFGADHKLPLSANLMPELKLLIAVHEARHAAMLVKMGKTSEYDADSEEYNFIKSHPEWFPILSNNPKLTRQIIAGQPALQWIESGDDTFNHTLIAFMDPNKTYDPINAPILRAARSDMALLISRELYKEGKIPSRTDAIMTAFERIIDPNSHRYSFEKKTEMNYDLSLDRSGFLRQYFQQVVPKGTDPQQAILDLANSPEVLKSNTLSQEVGVPISIKSISEAQKNTQNFLRKHHDMFEEFIQQGYPDAWVGFAHNQVEPTPLLLTEVLVTIRKLKDRGSLDGRPELMAFADNALGGAEVFGIELSSQDISPSKPENILVSHAKPQSTVPH